MWIQRSSRTSKLLPRKVFPKGSCHLVEPTWVTHLLRTASRIVKVECIPHANQTGHLVKRTRLQRWVLNVGLCGSKSDCETVQEMKTVRMIDTPVLGLAGSHKWEKLEHCRYVELIRLHITTNWQCLRWAVTVSRALPPCENLNWFG